MTEVLTKRLPSEADMDSRDLVMGDNQRVFYQCPPPTTDKAIPPITTSSPSHSRSPRCEAFLMTGDKMLNLNPKISPHYAKVSLLLIFDKCKLIQKIENNLSKKKFKIFFLYFIKIKKKIRKKFIKKIKTKN